jgi:uncharacterized membrane protein YeaQ/YmgE (transglycosylase-associated protein family)
MADVLFGLLLYALIVALLAFGLSVLLRTRQGALGYVGAGFLGEHFGSWLLSLVKVTEPVALSLPDGYAVRLVGALVGTAIVLLVFRLVTRRR